MIRLKASDGRLQAIRFEYVRAGDAGTGIRLDSRDLLVNLPGLIPQLGSSLRITVEQHLVGLRVERGGLIFQCLDVGALLRICSLLAQLLLKGLGTALGGFTSRTLLANLFVEARLRNLRFLLLELPLIVARRLFRGFLLGRRLLLRGFLCSRSFLLGYLLCGRLCKRLFEGFKCVALVHRGNIDSIEVNTGGERVKIKAHGFTPVVKGWRFPALRCAVVVHAELPPAAQPVVRAAASSARVPAA